MRALTRRLAANVLTRVKLTASVNKKNEADEPKRSRDKKKGGGKARQRSCPPDLKIVITSVDGIDAEYDEEFEEQASGQLHTLYESDGPADASTTAGSAGLQQPQVHAQSNAGEEEPRRVQQQSNRPTGKSKALTRRAPGALSSSSKDNTAGESTTVPYVLELRSPSTQSGVTLRRLGMRMYALACNSNTKCTQGGRKAQGLRFGDEITGINGQPVTGLSAEDAMDRLQECLNDSGACSVEVCPQPFVHQYAIEPDPDRSQWEDLVPEGHMITSVNGYNAVGLTNGEIVRLLRGGGLFDTMDSIVYEALTKAVGPAFVAKEAWNKPPREMVGMGAALAASGQA